MKNTEDKAQFCDETTASLLLEVSISTIREWEKDGILKSCPPPTKYFPLEQIQRIIVAQETKYNFKKWLHEQADK